MLISGSSLMIEPYDPSLVFFLDGLGIIKIIWKHWACKPGQVASARAQPPSLPLHVHKAKATVLICHLNLVYSNRDLTFSDMQASNQLCLFSRTAMIGSFYAPISKACSSMRTGKNTNIYMIEMCMSISPWGTCKFSTVYSTAGLRDRRVYRPSRHVRVTLFHNNPFLALMNCEYLLNNLLDGRSTTRWAVCSKRHRAYEPELSELELGLSAR